MSNISRNLTLSILPVLLVCIGVVSIIFVEGAYRSATILAFSFFQNVTFTLVSNARNRNSVSYHIVASVLSNGVWFVTFALLVQVIMAWNLLIPFVVGTTLGSLFGKRISLWIESILNLTADATKDELEVKLSLREQLSWFNGVVFKGRLGWLHGLKTSESCRSIVLFCTLFLIEVFSLIVAQLNDVLAPTLFLMVIAYLQNLGFTMSSRAKNRESHNYVIFTNTVISIVWFFTFQHLIEHQMAFMLLLPYTVSTVFGSLTGGWVSIKIERLFGFKPQEFNVAKPDLLRFVDTGTFLREWWLFIIVVLSGLVYMLLQVSPYGNSIVVQHTGMSFSALIFVLILFVGEQIFYTIANRASTRNNFNYHLCTRVVNGLAWFIIYRYVVVLNMSYEIMIPIVLGRIVGGVFGQKIGGYFEGRLGAVMDSKKPEASKEQKEVSM